jgi:hypothetical protein
LTEKAGSSAGPFCLRLSFAWNGRRSQRVSGTGSIRALSNYQAEDLDVRYWHKADMLNALTNVRFWGQSGH